MEAANHVTESQRRFDRLRVSIDSSLGALSDHLWAVHNERTADERNNAELLTSSRNAALRQCEALQIALVRLEREKETQVLEGIRLAEEERRTHAQRVEELLATGRRMEALLKAAVEENMLLKNDRFVRTPPAAVVMRTTGTNPDDDHLDCNTDASTLRPFTVHDTHLQQPLNWSDAGPRHPGDHHRVHHVVCLSASMTMPRRPSCPDRIDSAILVAIVAACALGSTPSTAGRCASFGLLETVEATLHGATKWTRRCGGGIATQGWPLDGARLWLCAQDANGLDVWWAHAVFEDWTHHQQSRESFDGASPVAVLMRWHCGVVVAGQKQLTVGAISPLRGDVDEVPAAAAHIRASLLEWHSYLSSQPGVEANGILPNPTAALVIEVVSASAGRRSRRRHLIVTTSSMLGVQQMLYVVGFNVESRRDADGNYTTATATAEGDWLAVDTLVRRVSSPASNEPQEEGGFVVSLTMVENTLAHWQRSADSRSPAMIPTELGQCPARSDPLEKAESSSCRSVRLMFQSWYSRRDGMVLHGVACNWDAWGSRDFYAGLVQLPNEVEDSCELPRRATASMVPRGDVGSSTFAIYCADWAALSPARHGGGDFVPCTVTLAFRAHDHPSDRYAPSSAPATARCVKFPTMRVPDDGEECTPRSEHITLNVDGQDGIGSDRWWTPISPLNIASPSVPAHTTSVASPYPTGDDG